DDIDGFPGGDCRRERTKIAIAVLDDLPSGDDSRPEVLCSDLDAQITLIVFEPDIVAWLILLDQIVFENQRFFVVAGDQCFNIFDAPHQKLDLRSLVWTIEIAAPAAAQVLGLADVDDLAAPVPHEVDPGPGRQISQFILY